MPEAVIVATARTPIGKAYRGAFHDTQGQALAGHAIAEAVRRAGVAPAEIEDVVLGCALQQGSTGYNVARQGAPWAGLPESMPGMTIGRQCGSDLMAVATIAKGVLNGELTVAVAGGVESISLVQNAHMNHFRGGDPKLRAEHPSLYMAMVETAEIVASRYGISRQAQDEYALRSQQRTAAAQAAGRHDAEIAPIHRHHEAEWAAAWAAPACSRSSDRGSRRCARVTPMSFDELLAVAPACTPTGGMARWTAPGAPRTDEPRLYGGLLVAQAIVAASRDTRRCHALHGLFIGVGHKRQPFDVAVERTRDGGSFSSRRVEIHQGDRLLFAAYTSHHDGNDGPEHAAAMPDVPPPEGLPDERDDRLGRVAEGRTPRRYLPYEMLDVRDGGLGRVQAASLDHAIWFQRDASVFTRDGTLVASVAQEFLARTARPPPGPAKA